MKRRGEFPGGSDGDQGVAGSVDEPPVAREPGWGVGVDEGLEFVEGAGLNEGGAWCARRGAKRRDDTKRRDEERRASEPKKLTEREKQSAILIFVAEGLRPPTHDAI